MTGTLSFVGTNVMPTSAVLPCFYLPNDGKKQIGKRHTIKKALCICCGTRMWQQYSSHAALYLR
jgi:hypothetical protein